MAEPNAYQSKSSEKKLRGEVFTPVWFAEIVVARAVAAFGQDSPGLAGVVVDPACGDGAFLEAVLRARPMGEVAPIFGFDLDAGNVSSARARLASVSAALGVAPNFVVECGDTLAPVGLMDPPAMRAMKQRTGDFRGGIDLVVGNPPYVDSKRLSDGEKLNLRAWYPSAAGGAADLCVYFLHAFLDRLAVNGRLAFIIPNKLLVAKFAEPLRERLVEQRALHELMFVSRLPLFEKTAVYPVVMVLGNEPASHVRVQRPNSMAECTTANVQTAPHELFSVTQPKCIFPLPEGEGEGDLLRHICENAGSRMSSVLDIRWTISFHATGLRDRYIFAEKPSSPHAMPFVGGARFSGNAEVQRYSATWAGTWIDYDEDRARFDKNSLPPVELFSGGVIPICQNALRLRAAWTERGWAFKDTFLLGRPRAVNHPLADHPQALVAILNSDLAHFFYANVFHASHVGGGYLHYLAPYVGEIPLGNWNDEQAFQAENLVARLARDPTNAALDREVQALVGKVFGLSDHQLGVVSRFARA